MENNDKKEKDVRSFCSVDVGIVAKPKIIFICPIDCACDILHMTEFDSNMTNLNMIKATPLKWTLCVSIVSAKMKRHNVGYLE